jgi:hypothetical protein
MTPSIHPTITAAQGEALQALQAALARASESGLLDVMAASLSHPDLAQAFTDQAQAFAGNNPVQAAPAQRGNDGKLKTYKDGLKDAASLLIQTAEDYESSFARRRDEVQSATKNRQLGVEGMKASLGVDQEKATLLRGQAIRVGELMEQRTNFPSLVDGPRG